MIIMINGTFGSGKTSAAYMLQPLIPDSMIFDPEEIGYMLRKIISIDHLYKEEQTDDFQDIELWRVLTVKTIEEIKKKYNKHLIIPMTIYKTENFDYIINGLRNIDHKVYHFCLIASEETIEKRIENRGDTFGPWYQKQTKAGVLAFNNERYEEHIETDHINTEEVIRTILKKVFQ